MTMKEMGIMICIFAFLLLRCKSDHQNKLLEKENKLNSKITSHEKHEKSKILVMKTIKSFIPENYLIVSSDTGLNVALGDLNKDGIQDAVLLLFNSNTTIEEAHDVRISILLGNQNGEFVPKTKSGNLSSAFIFNNLNKPQISINYNIISVVHQSMRHDYELKFRYENSYDDFMLIGSEYNNYGNALLDGTENVSSNYLASKRILSLRNKEKINTLLDNGLIALSELNDNNIYSLITNE